VTGPVEVEVEEPEKPPEEKKKKKRRWRKKLLPLLEEEEEEKGEKINSEKKTEGRKILKVLTENYEHQPFDQTQEVKAISAEVIKTIRDIIALNPLYRYVGDWGLVSASTLVHYTIRQY
jgi:Lon-like ATP-dependent protease